MQELRIGDYARYERQIISTTTNERDKVKPIEVLLANSLPNFRILKAGMTNFTQNDLPFGFNYTFTAP